MSAAITVVTESCIGLYRFPKPRMHRDCWRVRARNHSEWKTLFLSLCCLALGNVACGINVDVSLHSLRARWVTRNSLTVKGISSNLIYSFPLLHFPTLYLSFPSSNHTFASLLLAPLLLLLPSKQIREQMRREEWYGWWGMPECQQMTSSADGGEWGRRR